MERLKRLYMYSEDSISEQEYITERNRISEAYEDIEMRLSEISTCERTERSITYQDFIRQATAFIISKKLSGSSYINYRRLAANTDVQILKDFFNSIIDSITINSNGQIGSIVFKNGLLHRSFILQLTRARNNNFPALFRINYSVYFWCHSINMASPSAKNTRLTYGP